MCRLSTGIFSCKVWSKNNGQGNWLAKVHLENDHKNGGRYIVVFVAYVCVVAESDALQLCCQGHINQKGIPLEASFSPDSQFVFSGK